MDSIKALHKDALISSVLGDELLRKYTRAKTKEWDEFRLSVSDWEIRHYLEDV